MSESRNPALERARVALELRRYPEAIAQATQAVAHAPEESEPYAYLAQAHLGAGDHEQAERVARQALAFDSGSEWLHRLLAVALRRRKPQEALAAIDESLRLFPTNALGHQVRGDILRDLKRRDDALASYEQARTIDPDSADIYERLADLALEQKDWSLAEKRYRESLALNPQDAMVLNNLGVALTRQSKQEEARLAYRSAVALDPTLKVAKQNLHANVRSLVQAGAAGAGLLAWIVLRVLTTGAREGARAMGEPNSPVVGGVVVVGLFGLLGYWIYRRVAAKRRLEALQRTEPQLYAVYQQLEVDKKLKRL